MKIIAAQINPTIGDLKGNTGRIIREINFAKSEGADLVVFPEMALCGYPPEDFILLPHFMDAVEAHLMEIISASQGIALIVGLPRRNPRKFGKGLYNSAALIQDQKLIGFADKILLPTYDVFDERRYFEPGEKTAVWNLGGCKLAVTICEDLWQHCQMGDYTNYWRDPVLELQQERPSLVVNISASPYSLDKFSKRLKICLKAARTLECPVILCNQAGGNDSLIFDGGSLYTDPRGLIASAKEFAEDRLFIDLSKPQDPIEIERNQIEGLYGALVLGLRDYFGKLNFKKACLGLSGGVDSAVVACIAAEALGPQNVLGISMPSRYSSKESLRDSKALAVRLGIAHKEIPIEEPFECYLRILKPFFSDRATGVAEENLQARIRGMLLMAFSNKFGYLVLSTGNKSELAMGYSTLYGDMCGGLAVIGDVTKGQVYALGRWINRLSEVIPNYTLERPPSAELRPDQKDSDTLPDYEIVDKVVSAYIEEHRPPDWIAKHCHCPTILVEDLIRRIHMNEYKRRQSPPVLRVSEKSFSIGRRFPIVQGWV